MTGIQPLYTTGAHPAGAPKYGQGPYGMVPQLPAYTTDTSQSIGTDVQSQMIANLPNYLKMVGGDVGNIESNIAGQVSPQTTNLLSQQAAEWGQATGQPLSQAAATGFLAKYGLTSAQMQALGHQQLTQAMQRTPIQQTQLGTQTQDLAAQQAIYNAAPDPMQAAQANLAATRAGIGAGGAGGGGVKAPSATAAPTEGMGYGGGYSYGAGGTGSATYPGYIWDPSSGQYVKDPNWFQSQQAPGGYGMPDTSYNQWLGDVTGQDYSGGYSNLDQWGTAPIGGSGNEALDYQQSVGNLGASEADYWNQYGL